MPQIASGSNATFTVPANYVIDVQCPGGWVQLEYPVGTKVFEGNPAGQTFGPYAGGSAKLTSVKGDIYYEVDPKTGGVDTPFDPSSVAITGGSILARNLLRNVGSWGRPMTVIPAGDSITQANSLYTGGMWQFGSGYAEVSILQSGARMRVLRNAGISGNTAAQLLARLQTDVIAYAPDICTVMIGTNDLSSGMANSAYTTLFNTIEQIVLQLLKAGILPVIVTPPPKNAAVTESKNAQWYYYALAQYYGLPLIDMYRVLVDPATGSYTASYTSDGTHPLPAGVTQMVAAATPVLSNLAGSVCAPYLAAVSDSGFGNFANIIANGSFAKVTASPTPDTWTVNATGATQTIPAATLPYTGNKFTYNKTSSGAAYALFGAAPTVAGGSYAVGDTLQMNVRLKVSGLTPASATGLQLLLLSDTGAKTQLTNYVQNGDYVLSTELVVPASTTTLTPQLFVNDIALYEVNNWTLFNVSKANAIWRPGQQ